MESLDTMCGNKHFFLDLLREYLLFLTFGVYCNLQLYFTTPINCLIKIRVLQLPFQLGLSYFYKFWVGVQGGFHY